MNLKKILGLTVALLIAVNIVLLASGAFAQHSDAQQNEQGSEVSVEETANLLTEEVQLEAQDRTVVAAAADTEDNTADPSTEDTLETAAEETQETDVQVTTVTGGIVDGNELFTSRDLIQSVDTSGCTTYTVSDGEDIHITEEGIYVLTGTASHATVYVEAADDAKIQLVLDDLHITNENYSCIYVVNAKKVFVTTASDSSLTVTDAFYAGESVDAAIYSSDDLVLNGTATLSIISSDKGIVGNDDLKITGGSYIIDAASVGIKANDSIRIADGNFSLTCGTDGLHAENSDDDSLGYIYICGGSLDITAGDDAVHAIAFVQIDGGLLNINAAEGIEASYIQINDGQVNIQATDDGINAAWKSSYYSAVFELNGGDVIIILGSGDTDAVDSNGDVYINGGTINLSASNAFDYDGYAEYNGGVLYVNGQQIDYIPNAMMGGMSNGGMSGGEMAGDSRGW